MQKKSIARFLLIFIVLLAFAGSVFAQEISVEFGNENLDVQKTSVPLFIQNFYVFTLGVGGVVAVGMIIFGGIFFSLSGAIDKKNEGKEIILGAIWGLVLLIASYVILRTVNPRLVELELPDLNKAGLQSCQSIENLRFCNAGESERDPNTGECQCRTKPVDGCPISMQKKSYTREKAPNYRWIKGIIPDRRELYEAPNLPDVSDEPGVCPSIVKLQAGTTPYFITSADKEDDGGLFFMDLSKQPAFPTLTFPLPEGEYYGHMTTYHITGKKDRTLCMLTTIEDLTNNKSINVYLTGDKKDVVPCTNNYSTNVENAVKIQVKKTGFLSGEECPLGTRACAPDKLKADCPEFESEGDLDKASRICVRESQEDVASKSYSDFCKNEAGKPKEQKHSFSMGLFQINVIANGKMVTQKTNDASCEGLFDKTSGPKKLPGGSSTGYDCNFNVGKEAQWERCRQILSDPRINIQLACQLYKNADNDLEGPWKTSYEACDL